MFSLIKDICVFFIIVNIISCNSIDKESKKDSYIKNTRQLTNKYAKSFEIVKNENKTYCVARNPWQKAEGIEFKYLLSPDVENNNDHNDDQIYIQIPVRRVICLSTTHIGYLSSINELNSIVGISGANYINNKYLKNKLANGEITEIGYEQNLNFEHIIKLKPDVVFAYSVGSENIGYLSKITELGIPVVYIAEYLESHPLGKVEWINYFASFYNKINHAQELFNKIESEYNKYKSIVSDIKFQPNVLVGLPWKGSWFVPGGKSEFTRLITDAGGNYLWKDNDLRRSHPLSLEEILTKGQKAQYWLNCGSANSLEEILKIENRLKDFPVVKSGNIYNNNARQNESGGNDFWESGVMNPHIILKDLICILHPELNMQDSLYYYKKIY